MQRRPIIYFSGIDREEHLKLLEGEQAAGMVNARSLMQLGLLNAIRNHPHVPLVLDSGYENKPSFDNYVALLDFLDAQYPGRFRWFTSYDFPGQQERSDESYEELVARLPHLRQQILWVFHPAWGTRSERARHLQRLETACKAHMRFAVGSLVPLVRRSVRDALTLLQEIGEVFNAYYPTEAHLLGITSPDLLAWARTQPWAASLDSSRWVRAARAHEVLLLSGEQRKASALQLPLTQDECAALNIRVMQTWVDGPPLPIPWADSDGKESDSSRWIRPGSRDDDLPTLLRHRGRRTLCATLDLASPSLDWYIPLFTVSGREHGLLAFGYGETLPLKADWSVIWDVDIQDDPLLPRSRLFLLDGRLKTGLFSHDDVFLPCLCRYPLGLALRIAKSLVPFSETADP